MGNSSDGLNCLLCAAPFIGDLADKRAYLDSGLLQSKLYRFQSYLVQKIVSEVKLQSVKQSVARQTACPPGLPVVMYVL